MAKDAYGRSECKDCGGRFYPEPSDFSAVHICCPMVVRLKKERKAYRQVAILNLGLVQKYKGEKLNEVLVTGFVDHAAEKIIEQTNHQE